MVSRKEKSLVVHEVGLDLCPGIFLHIAHEEGLIRNTSIHAGIRGPLIRRKGDLRNDMRCGFEIVTARDIDRIGVGGVIRKLKERVGNSRVYISVVSHEWQLGRSLRPEQ